MSKFISLDPKAGPCLMLVCIAKKSTYHHHHHQQQVLLLLLLLLCKLSHSLNCIGQLHCRLLLPLFQLMGWLHPHFQFQKFEQPLINGEAQGRVYHPEVLYFLSQKRTQVELEETLFCKFCSLGTH